MPKTYLYLRSNVFENIMTPWVIELDIVDLVTRLIAFNTVNPPGNQNTCADFIADYLNNFSNVKTYVKDGVKNIVAEIIFSRVNKSIVFNGHWDTVPAIVNEWSNNPFIPVVKDGWIYGRGSGDMKGGLAAMMSAFEKLSKREDLNGRIALMAVGDEETGGRRGTQYVLDNYNKDIHYVVIGEPTGLKLKVGRRGIIRVRVKIFGEERHSAYVYEKCLNPIEVASELIKYFSRLDLRDGTEIMPRTTFAVTMVKGGIKENIIPRECEFVVDIRNTPFVNVDRVEALLNKKLQELEEKYKGIEFKITVNDAGKPYLLTKAYIVKISTDVLKELGLCIQYDAGGGASDGRFFIEKNITNVVEFGPIAKNIHGVDEAVNIRSIYQSESFYEKIAEKILD